MRVERTTHIVAPGEQGVVTRFGRYTHTLNPGVGLTMPWPINRVQKIDVENIQTVDLGTTGTETLMLTGDQNIVDIAYSVRWNIREPELYLAVAGQRDVLVVGALRSRISFTLDAVKRHGR